MIARLHVATELQAALGLSDEDLARRVGRLARLARTHWVTLSHRRLFTSQREYTQGIQEVEHEGMGASITLLGDVANMVEQGAVAYDLRDTILRGEKQGHVRWNAEKTHRYAHIPFRSMTATATGRNAPILGETFAALPKGHQDPSRAFRGTMSPAGAAAYAASIYAVAKDLSPTTTTPAVGQQPRRTNWGDSIKPSTATATLRPRHAGPLYAGMYRLGKGYDKAEQGQYRSFRTISENPESFRKDSGGLNWTHPGITARRLLDSVLSYLQEVGPTRFWEDEP